MSEKETPESVEMHEREEAVEEIEEVEAQSSEEEPENIEAASEVQEKTVPEAPAAKKGLMQRRPDYSQSSVPNAHRGYSGTPPIIMLLIISVFVLLSIIFATSAVIN